METGFLHPQILSSRFQKGSISLLQEEFVKYLTIKGLSAKSIKTYSARFRIFNQWLIDRNFTLNRTSIEEFLFEKKKAGYSNSGINSYIQSLNYLQKYFKSHGSEILFMVDIETLPKEKSKVIALSLSESYKLIDTPLVYKNRNGVDCNKLDLTYLTLTEFILFTGCRYHEASSLKISQLDIDEGTSFLTDTKTKEPRYLLFDGIVKEHLRQLTKNKSIDDLVFTNSKGNEIHSGDFWSNLKKRAKKAGITKKVHPHILRHTYATLYYKKTHDISMVARLLGHKDFKTTHDTYVHTDFEEIQLASRQHPLLSRYTSTNEVLQDYKNSFEKIYTKEDDRFEYIPSLSDNELIIKVKLKGA